MTNINHQLSTINYQLSIYVIAAIVAAPVLFILSNILAGSGDIWGHLATTVLPLYIQNSLLLTALVGIGVITIGVTTAWLVTACNFPGSRTLEWLLLLPLAAPAYLLAYVYTDFLDFAGPVQTTLRHIFGWEYGEYWFPNIRSLGGAVTLMSLTLYPYVYLICRVAFLEQSACALEASRVLGCGPWRSFFAVALPLARPGLAAGTALALMETLNDFGTVQYFGVQTFTTGIYRTWFGMGEHTAATQLAACLLLFVLGLILIERWSRRRAAYYQTTTRYDAVPTYQLQGIRLVGAWVACFLPVALGFLLPAGLLLQMTVSSGGSWGADSWIYGRNSLILAGLTALIAAVVAVVMAYGLRLHPKAPMRLAARVAAMGYAVPGSVIAVGIMVPVGKLDNAIDSTMRATFNISTGLLFSGTITALVFAYLVRFLAVSFNTIEASLTKIEPCLDDAARSLGHSSSSTLMKVHLPMMRGGVLTAGMLVFVDVMKELPATIVIRPFNFDTLAVRVYNLASDERLAEAAGPALAIVLVGIIPVIVLSLKIAQSRRGN